MQNGNAMRKSGQSYTITTVWLAEIHRWVQAAAYPTRSTMKIVKDI